MATSSREGTPAQIITAITIPTIDNETSNTASPAPSLPQTDEPITRTARIKKDSQKKREADPRQPSEPIKHVPVADKGFTAQRFVLAQLRPKDFALHHPPTLNPQPITLSDKTPIEYYGRPSEKIIFNEQLEYVRNQKIYRYHPAVADPTFPHSYFYRKSETTPFHARFEYQDIGTAVLVDDTGLKLAGTAGWRSARANVCAKFGKYYHEIKIIGGMTDNNRNTASSPHVRIGYARKEAGIELNVGFDCYSYGIMDKGGQTLWKSNPTPFFPPGENIEQGDIIGLEISLPSERFHRNIVRGDYNPLVDLSDDWTRTQESADILRDRIPIRFRNNVYFEHEEYEVSEALKKLHMPWVGGVHKDPPNPIHELPEFRTLPGSYIKVWKNGVYMGTAFRDLLAFLPPASKSHNSAAPHRTTLDDGSLGYYPTISLFYGAAIEANFGPNFWFPPPGLEEEDDVDMINHSASDTEENKGDKVEQGAPVLKPMCERYAEQICEDIMGEIVDEVDFLYNADKGVVSEGTREIVKGVEIGVREEDEEIKEIVQDE